MFEEHVQNIIELLQGNPPLSIGIAVVVAALFYFHPKDMFKLTAFCLFLVAVFYIMTLLLEATGTGSKQKDQMIYKSKEVIGE